MTGAAGFLGSGVCGALHAAGHEVLATDLRHPGKVPYSFRVKNLLQREVSYELLEADPGVIVHLGNHPNKGRADAQRVYTENLGMNMNLFQAAHEVGIPKLIFASSIQAVCPGEKARMGYTSLIPYLPADAGWPHNPGNTYALSKCATESMLDYFVTAGTPSAISLRFPVLLGQRYLDQIKTKLANQAREPVQNPWSKPLELFSYLVIEDAAALIRAVAEADLPGYRVYFPAASDNLLQRSTSDMRKEFYKSVAWRKDAPRGCGLIDLSQITAETGWKPVHLLSNQ